MAHLFGLLIFVLLLAAQVAAIVALHRNERRHRDGQPRRPVHGLPSIARLEAR